MKSGEIIGFSKTMAMLAVAYDKEVSKELNSLYFEVLKKYEIDEIKSAIVKHLESSKFFPKPSEIIELIKPKESLCDKAELAWLKLLNAISRHGYYDSVEFDDPVIHSCVRAMGGWCSVSDRLQDTWMHKAFKEFYNSYANKPDHPLRVVGHLESAGGKYAVSYLGDMPKQVSIPSHVNNENTEYKQRLSDLTEKLTVKGKP